MTVPKFLVLGLRKTVISSMPGKRYETSTTNHHPTKQIISEPKTFTARTAVIIMI